MVVYTQKLVILGTWVLIAVAVPNVEAEPNFKGMVSESLLTQVGNFRTKPLYCLPRVDRKILGKGLAQSEQILFTEITPKKLLSKIKQKIKLLACSSSLNETCSRLRRDRKQLRAAQKRCDATQYEQPNGPPEDPTDNDPNIPDPSDTPTPGPSDSPTPEDSPTSTPTQSPTPTSTPPPTATPSSLALCFDGVDNDGDSLVDQSDSECREFPYSESLVSNGATDSNGWTVFRALPETRKVYVSASQGADTNSGLSENDPKRTIAAAKSLLRHGSPDWLLLRRGDTFNEALGTWRTGGVSPTAPALIASYGTALARPLLRTSGQSGFSIGGGGGTPADLGNVAIIGIDLSAQPRDALTQNPTGIVLQKNGLHDVLIEDTRISEFKTGLVAQITGGEITDLRIRLNQIFDQYSGDGSHSQGIYTDEVRRLLIEGNLIDRNGTYGSGDPNADPPDIFKHNMYIQGDSREVTIRANISTRASSHGLQLRPGGTIEGNVFLDNPINCMIAGAAGEFSQVSSNIFAEPAHFITPNLPRGKNLDIENLDGIDVSSNLFQTTNPTDSSSSLSLLRGNELAPLHNVTIRENVFYGGGKLLDMSDFGATPISNINIIDNDLQQVIAYEDDSIQRVNGSSTMAVLFGSQNRYYSLLPIAEWIRTPTGPSSLSNFLSQIGDSSSSASHVQYSSPRSVDGYFQLLLGSGADLDEFLSLARSQNKLSFDPALSARSMNAWMRTGFDLP